jgi:hypothetical protein
MSRKNACICLLLILTATWIDRLATGSFIIAPPTRTPSFGEEIYTFAMRDRNETRATVEAPPLSSLHETPFSVPLAGPSVIRLQRVVVCIITGADACYLLMSLQR